jgi:hypothetical protein
MDPGKHSPKFISVWLTNSKSYKAGFAIKEDLEAFSRHFLSREEP